MSESRHQTTESDSVHELRHSREFSYTDTNINKDYLFMSLSTASPTGLSSKSRSHIFSHDQEKIVKEKKKLEKDYNLLIDNIKKV